MLLLYLILFFHRTDILKIANMSFGKDVEKVQEASYEAHSVDAVGHSESINYGTGIFAKAQRLAGRFGVEQRGIERVLEHERTDNKRPLLNVGTMVDMNFKTTS